MPQIKQIDKQDILNYIREMSDDATLPQVITVLKRLEGEQRPERKTHDQDGNPIINKRTVLDALARLPNDASMAEILDSVDVLYRIKKSLTDPRPSIPHQQAKQLMAERLKQKEANED